MESETTHILVVANRSIATPALLDEIRRRAEAGRCEFVLLVPDAPPGRAGEWLLRHALRLFERAIGEPVEGSLARECEPLEAISTALRAREYDEVILSTLPAWGSRWLRQGVPARVEQLGVPVTVVTPGAQRTPTVPA